MFARLRRMLVKELLQIFRDPRMRAILIGVPLFQTVVFGYAVNTDVRDVRLAISDRDRTPASRDFIAGFTASRYFTEVAYPADEAGVQAHLDRGTARAVLVIMPGFAAELGAGRTAAVQLLLDGTDSTMAGKVAQYAQQIAARWSEARLREQAPAGGLPGGVALVSRAWFNENLESRNFFLPGVIIILVALVTMLLSSMAVVREKEIGTIEQVMVTPLRRSEFILGKTIPFALIGFLDVLLITAIAVFWFEIPLRGSVALLLAGTGLYILSTLGMGLLISTICTTQQQAMMCVFFVIFPAMLLSGFMFPIANMPALIQGITYLNPLRYFLVIIRAIFLKGTGWAVLWPNFAALGLIGTALLALAINRFHKTL